MRKNKKRNSVTYLEKAAKNFNGDEIVSLKVALEALNIERNEIMGNISKVFNEFLNSVL